MTLGPLRTPDGPIDGRHHTTAGSSNSARGWTTFERTLIGLADELFRNAAITDRTWARPKGPPAAAPIPRAGAGAARLNRARRGTGRCGRLLPGG